MCDYEKYIEENIISIVEEYIDDNINSSNPYEEWGNGDVILMSKYDFGIKIIHENFDVDDENFDGIEFDKLYDLVEEYMNDIVCGILNGAIEYCDNNNINYHM